MAVFYASSGGPNYAERDLPTTDFLGERETGTHAESRMEKGDVEWREGEWRAHIRLFKEGCRESRGRGRIIKHNSQDLPSFLSVFIASRLKENLIVAVAVAGAGGIRSSRSDQKGRGENSF